IILEYSELSSSISRKAQIGGISAKIGRERAWYASCSPGWPKRVTPPSTGGAAATRAAAAVLPEARAPPRERTSDRRRGRGHAVRKQGGTNGRAKLRAVGDGREAHQGVGPRRADGRQGAPAARQRRGAAVRAQVGRGDARRPRGDRSDRRQRDRDGGSGDTGGGLSLHRLRHYGDEHEHECQR